jgi:hypothetical protein
MNKILAIFLLLAAPAFAEAPHGDEGREIDVSSAAVKNYEIQTETFPAKIILLPRDAVVASKGDYFAYEKEGGHFREIEIRPLKITGESVLFSHRTAAEFVISGAKYLRVIFLNAKNPEASHTH